MRLILLVLRNAAAALTHLFQRLVRGLFPAPPVEWVTYELNGPLGRGALREELPAPAFRLPSGPRVSTLTRLRQELSFLATLPSPAAGGPRGVVLRLAEAKVTTSVLLELRALLLAFRSTGREVVVHADALSQRGYWLASAADRVWLSPRGHLELTGVAAAATAAARPLARLGMSFDVIRAGRFKSAGELVSEERVSDEQHEQVDALVGDAFQLFLEDVAPARGLDPEALAHLVDQGPFTAARARALGLVDDLLYADEVRARLGALPLASDAAGGAPQPPSGPSPAAAEDRRARMGPFAATLATYSPPPPWRPLRDRRPQVALVDVEGAITHGRSRAIPGVAGGAGSETLVALLTRLRRDPQVRAVVLRIASPGGSALASDLIWRAAQRLSEKKPVVAFLDGVAASGGYYIAAAAKRIVAAPITVTGSIGVILLRPDVTGTLELAGIDRRVIRRGAHAALHRPDVALDEEARASLERDVLEIYEGFLAVVAEGRGLALEAVRALAGGRVYLAPRARELGLLDSLGTVEDALDEARRLAELPEAIRVVRYRSKQAGFREIWRDWRRSVEDAAGSAATALALARSATGRERVHALWTGEVPFE